MEGERSRGRVGIYIYILKETAKRDPSICGYDPFVRSYQSIDHYVLEYKDPFISRLKFKHCLNFRTELFVSVRDVEKIRFCDCTLSCLQ